MGKEINEQIEVLKQAKDLHQRLKDGIKKIKDAENSLHGNFQAKTRSGINKKQS